MKKNVLLETRYLGSAVLSSVPSSQDHLAGIHTALTWSSRQARHFLNNCGIHDRSTTCRWIFNVIRFANDPCAGTGNRNGTCYTEVECFNRKGVPAGTCASGYGVCCTFSASCGQTSNENCTYFDSGNVPAGACRVRICRCDDNVCQLRLDFNSFVIAGPSTSTITIGKQTNGIIIVAGKPVNPATQCLVDRFSVTNPGSSTPPTICGTNTGEHMYVDANEACNELAFQLGSSSSVNRQWSIKVTQYSCDYDNLAPQGCTNIILGTMQAWSKPLKF
ncbi:uncharacterized protein LOC131879615 [Tigriopus californicus]|uniref:uncharacterized protein LOC131879615 n=1 Tax=Tigriopus californicus TaxID=6832 RepID=UPI0027DA6D7C|nr:uncharacterized protein LOC131879615 [Tigriopus californicus]